ncbi:phosphoenolpyruvate--protein phosphotransferase [Rhizobium sp. LjRoot254]|uniref:phosphoenolpyruvate--protein phosphotransferase n=1 Tax=Rhizobium sp. LjRoot254 TaxID=3342297 RepID=UPI003ECFA30E
MSRDEQVFTGTPASAGFAIGPVFCAALAAHGHYQRHKSTDAEYAHLVHTVELTMGITIDMMSKARGDAADILEFQAAMLGDDTFRDAAKELIDNGMAADLAWSQVLDAEIENYAQSEEEYFRARTADLIDIKDRVLRELRDELEAAIPENVIYLADDIAPTTFLFHNWTDGGIVLRQGSPTSHVAMLARQRGVPMVVGIGGGHVDSGLPSILDAQAGRFIVQPDDASLRTWKDDWGAFERKATVAARFAPKPGRTADGVSIAVHVNIADPHETEAIDIGHVDGVGLMRTEFLYNSRLPDEETQYAAYRKVLLWAGGKPVTIRTADAGGDKPVPGFTEAESNPFLGVRGIRLCLAKPHVFQVQIRALLRAGVHGNLKIMLPMVSVPDEIEQARALFDEEMRKLEASGVAFAPPELGIMVEVPSVAITPERFSKAAFFSIGSNDLTQYVMAASRDSGALAKIAEASNPAVLSLIGNVARYGLKNNIPISLCGDAGSDPELIPLLLKAGLRSVSVAASRIGMVKAAIAEIDLQAMERTA